VRLGPLHVSIHTRPPELVACEPIWIRGQLVTPWRVSPESLRLPMALSFEEAAERLRSLPRMFLEPDGSFVWVSSSQRQRWQVDGVLYDREGRLLFVDVKADCPAVVWRQFLKSLGAETTPLLFHLVHESVFLDEVGFGVVCGVEAPDDDGELGK
jgi:hypothetical protein